MYPKTKELDVPFTDWELDQLMDWDAEAAGLYTPADDDE